MVSQTINNRYTLLGTIGKGGMGIVYRAYDRLNGTEVALKHVALNIDRTAINDEASSHSAPTIYAPSTGLLSSLAQEFRVLSSLRHPNIISVLDYGFDDARRPFFTMELLEDAHLITKASAGQSLEIQIDMLAQILQALAYLHRRGIIHRDLKPDNILVTGDHVRVLDFGLAVAREYLERTESDFAGTVAYASPEAILGETVGEASDLYTFGVIAYELFARRHPHNTGQSAGELIFDILTIVPDFSELDIPASLRAIIQRLLSKEPTTRYSDAQELLRALHQAAGREMPPESTAVRESFLQASALVGREQELKHLRTALTDTIVGSGSAWLVGGESGVGKTRLVNEIRTQALVYNTIVLWNEGVHGSDTPYLLWREPLRHLVLADVPISNMEAGILKTLVPDIDKLLNREIADVPPLVGQAEQRRLTTTIVDLVRRVTAKKPIILLFGDLQWAQASLDPIQALIPFVDAIPLLFIGNYRDDEVPHLPDELPDCRHIKLNRLNRDEIAALAQAMLGSAGKRPDLVELLEHETEGNAFFVVEVVRSLAEQAGNLRNVEQITLPDRVTPGGIQEIVSRRLGHVPEEARPLLKLAAVDGRDLDLSLIQHLGDLQLAGLTHWLGLCSDAAVLEVQEGQWRFAHARLREGLLDSLGEDELAGLHYDLAEGIEAVYPDDTSRAAALAEHWYHAREDEKCTHYARIAAQQAICTCQYQTVLRIFDLARQPDALLYKLRGDAYEGLGDYAAAAQAYQNSLTLARDSEDQPGIVAALNGLATISWRQSEYPLSIKYSEESLNLARSIDDKPGIALCLSNLGICSSDGGAFETAQVYYEECLYIRRKIGDLQGVGYTLNSLGVATGDQGKYSLAQDYFQQALSVAREIGDLHEVVFSLYGLAGMASALGDHLTAHIHAVEGLAIARELGGLRGISLSLYRLGVAEGYLENNPQAGEEGLAIAREIGDRRLIACIAHDLGLIACYHQDYDKARSYHEESLRIRQEIQTKMGIVMSLNALGMLDYLRGDTGRACQKYDQSLSLAETLNNNFACAINLTRLALIEMDQGEHDQATHRLKAALQYVKDGEAQSAALQVILGIARLYQVRGDTQRSQQLVKQVKSHPVHRNSDVMVMLPFLPDAEPTTQQKSITSITDLMAQLEENLFRIAQSPL